ncbi:MAG TPA: FAD-dependent oxidoreductase [Steroidobacteraceae bacterium]|nr:FAD-dependent oxidoreductase [Steroidobacteraceae bacterium]
MSTIQRDTAALANEQFDVLVIGGGACGAATARESALRGFKTALIEREDFSAGASAHCFKVVHGGIRYIQHADIRRLRASCHERAALLSIAPHLVAPLPFVIPTYGHAKSSRWFLGTGMMLYDTLTLDVNRHIPDPARRVSRTRFLGRSETLGLFPDIEQRGLTGAAVFEDGQMHSPPRLVLGFAAAAAELGAAVSNYVEAESLLLDGDRVIGANALDHLSGQRFPIRARLVINGAGPWSESLLQIFGQRHGPPGTYSRDTCFLIDRRYAAPMALAVQGQVKDSDALLARNSRHLFMVPWRNSTLVGVWHLVVPRDPDAVSLPAPQLQQFIDELNACHPALGLSEADVRRVDFGLVPFGEASKQRGGLSFGKQSRLIDHREHGISGLLSVISVRYTVARRDAEDVMNLAAAHLGQRGRGEDSSKRPLPGGDIADFPAALRSHEARRPPWLQPESIDGLLHNFGTRLQDVLALAEQEPALQRYFSGSPVTFAEAVYAVRAEMACRMTDIVFRRTELGTDGHPGPTALDELQSLLIRELHWSEQRAAEERVAVEREFVRYRASSPPMLSPAKAASARTA